MSKAALSEFKRGTCDWCQNEDEVYRDNGLCQQCDADTIVCSICKHRVSDEFPCRHVFKDREFQWQGSGAHDPDDSIKRSFNKLLDLMPIGFAPDLRKAIVSGKFYTVMIAPMIGGGGLLELHGMPDREGIRFLFGWGDALIEIGEGQHAEETADAYHWLASLYKNDAAKANRTTINWIEEWQAPLLASNA